MGIWPIYIGFVTRGFEMLWCGYLWVGTSPCGGLGKFRNMKCSRSDSRPILGLFRVSS